MEEEKNKGMRMLAKLRKDEDGQGLLYTAFILLVLVAFALTVLDVGTVVDRKVQAQTAADAAALSGAALQARTLNLLSFLNVSMAACYGLMATAIIIWATSCVLSLVPVVGVPAVIVCTFCSNYVPSLNRNLHKLAKQINKLETKIVENVQYLVAIEMYRIGHKNLTNDHARNDDFADYADQDDNATQNQLSAGLGSGAAGMDGNLHIPPSIKNVVQPGNAATLFAQLPWPLNKIKFKKPGAISYTAATTYSETTTTQQRVCPPRGYRHNRECRACHKGRYATADGCTTFQKIKIEKKTKSQTKGSNYSDGANDEWPIPYQLREAEWKKGLRVCALAFRFEKEKARVEPLVNDRDMLPYNFCLAEAEAYDAHGRQDKDLLLFRASWDARLVSLTLHQELLKKYGMDLPALSDQLVTH
jgi:hypothetical protein